MRESWPEIMALKSIPAPFFVNLRRFPTDLCKSKGPMKVNRFQEIFIVSVFFLPFVETNFQLFGMHALRKSICFIVWDLHPLFVVILQFLIFYCHTHCAWIRYGRWWPSPIKVPQVAGWAFKVVFFSIKLEIWPSRVGVTNHCSMPILAYQYDQGQGITRATGTQHNTRTNLMKDNAYDNTTHEKVGRSWRERSWKKSYCQKCGGSDLILMRHDPEPKLFPRVKLRGRYGS